MAVSDHHTHSILVERKDAHILKTRVKEACLLPVLSPHKFVQMMARFGQLRAV